MTDQCLFHVENNGSTLDLEICKDIPTDHENLECYLSIWEKLKSIEFGDMHISIASEIAASLALTGQYDLFGNFLADFQKENIHKLTQNERFLRAYIALKFEQRAYRDVYSLLENGSFRNTSGLLEVWDEAHYREKQIDIGRPLTPLIRFRIRKRNPPPTNICPSGERPSSRITDESRDMLREWFEVNRSNPYPSPETKTRLARDTGLSVYQVKTWFANARRRIKVSESEVNTGRKRACSEESDDCANGNSTSSDTSTSGTHYYDKSSDTQTPLMDSDHHNRPNASNIIDLLSPEAGQNVNVGSKADDSLKALAAICSHIGCDKFGTNMAPTPIHYPQQHTRVLVHEDHGPSPRQNQCVYSGHGQVYYTNDSLWTPHDNYPMVVKKEHLDNKELQTNWQYHGWNGQQNHNQATNNVPNRVQQVRYICNQTVPVITSYRSLSRPRSCPPSVVTSVSPNTPCWQNQCQESCIMETTELPSYYSIPVEYQIDDTGTGPRLLHNNYIQNPVIEQEAAQGLLYLAENRPTEY